MSAWSRLHSDPDWCQGKGAYPLPAYSEYMPPPFLVPRPYDEPGAVSAAAGG